MNTLCKHQSCRVLFLPINMAYLLYHALFVKRHSIVRLPYPDARHTPPTEGVGPARPTRGHPRNL